jgi:hypothetical protein
VGLYCRTSNVTIIFIILIFTNIIYAVGRWGVVVGEGMW